MKIKLNKKRKKEIENENKEQLENNILTHIEVLAKDYIEKRYIEKFNIIDNDDIDRYIRIYGKKKFKRLVKKHFEETLIVDMISYNGIVNEFHITFKVVEPLNNKIQEFLKNTKLIFNLVIKILNK